MNKKEKRYTFSDVLLSNGEEQVSSYLKERKVLKYIKSNVLNTSDFFIYEDKIINAPDNILNELYEKITEDPEIPLAKLLPHVIKANKRSYSR